jgi:hypothetical protein
MTNWTGPTNAQIVRVTTERKPVAPRARKPAREAGFRAESVRTFGPGSLPTPQL